MTVVHGTNNSETIDADDGVTNGGDLIFGHDGNDTIWGLGGNDIIIGGNGADEINGGSGTDTANYLQSVEGVHVNLATGEGSGGTAEGDTFASIENLIGSAHDDLLSGDGGSNELSGQDGDDWIYGQDGDDSIWGFDGNDRILPGDGADEIYGGSGIDVASYSDSPEGVYVNLATGQGSGGTAQGDTLDGIESLTGSWHGDTLVGDGGSNVLLSSAGDDTLKGAGGADTLYGGKGNDELKGGGGADAIDGGVGIDTASYRGSSAGVVVSLITDTAFDGDAEGDELDNIENLVGSSLDDVLFGDDGANVLNGENGDDVLKGFGGADTLTGGDGGDLILGGAGADNLNGGSGTDTLSYEESASGVKVHLGANTASGGDAAGDTIFSFENLTGSSHGDELRGNSLANRLKGGDGNDVFDGGGGVDTLTGGNGNDSFGFQVNHAHNDTVTDFDGNGAMAGDQLVFAGFGPGATFSKVNATTWQITYNGGASQETIHFSNAAAITASDYVFI